MSSLFGVDHFVHVVPDRQLLELLMQMQRLHTLTHERLTFMAKTLDEMLAQGAAILAQVTKNADLDSSIISITNAYAAQLADLKAQLVAAATDKTKLAALADTMQALSDKAAAEGQAVADAITANTPAADPTATPAPDTSGTV